MGVHATGTLERRGYFFVDVARHVAALLGVWIIDSPGGGGRACLLARTLNLCAKTTRNSLSPHSAFEAGRSGFCATLHHRAPTATGSGVARDSAEHEF